MTNLLNPKVCVFMIAFLPQFTDPASGAIWFEMLLLGAAMKVNGVLFLGACAIAASRMRYWIERHRWLLRLQDGILGLTMIGLAGYILFDKELRAVT